MDMNNINNQAVIIKLQNDVQKFLMERKLVFDNTIIHPKEIEVYYWEKDVFEDSSVHRNALQQNNKNHFYIHRWGYKKEDAYKGGNYPGLDFVISGEEGVYYTYLIRSAVINGKLIVGPHKVLTAVLESSGLEKEDLEKTIVELQDEHSVGSVLLSERINLGKNAKEFAGSILRVVLCDEYFLGDKYPLKERMIVDQIKKSGMCKDEAVEYAKDKLGYVPSSIRTL